MTPDPIGEGMRNKPIIDREEVGRLTPEKRAERVLPCQCEKHKDTTHWHDCPFQFRADMAEQIREVEQQAQLAAVVRLADEVESWDMEVDSLVALANHLRSLKISNTSLEEHDKGIRSQERERCAGLAKDWLSSPELVKTIRGLEE